MRLFARGLCYVEIKELIHNQRLLILFRPPQVVTCSSASASYRSSPDLELCTGTSQCTSSKNFIVTFYVLFAYHRMIAWWV